MAILTLFWQKNIWRYSSASPDAICLYRRVVYLNVWSQSHTSSLAGLPLTASQYPAQAIPEQEQSIVSKSNGRPPKRELVIVAAKTPARYCLYVSIAPPVTRGIRATLSFVPSWSNISPANWSEKTTRHWSFPSP